MKRAKQLQPLSRQHHLGLHVGRHAKECADSPQEITKHWLALSSYINDMRHHFSIEDNLMVDALRPHQSTHPEVADALETLEQQHQLLHKMTAQLEACQNDTNHSITANQVKELGQLLYNHIRFEERTLFPIVETYLSKDELDAIYTTSPDHIKQLDQQR